MTSTGEADRHHLLDAVLQKIFRAAGHLGTASSACPSVLQSVKTWRHQPKNLISICCSQIRKRLPHGLLYLWWYPALCILMMLHSSKRCQVALRPIGTAMLLCTGCTRSVCNGCMQLTYANTVRYICHLVCAIHDASKQNGLCVTGLQNKTNNNEC